MYNLKDPELHKLRTNYDWHVFGVYNDVEFQREMAIHKKDFRKFAPRNLSTLHSFRPDTPSSIIEDFIRIRDYYEISTPHMIMYIWPSYYGTITEPLGHIKFDTIWNRIELSLPYTITKKEYLEYWDRIYNYKKGSRIWSHKVKPAEYPDLVYAIFKAKKKHTYEEIYQMYMEDSLPGYKGPRSLTSRYGLERYYSRHKHAVT